MCLQLPFWTSFPKGTCCHLFSSATENEYGVTLHLTPKLALTLLLASASLHAQTAPEPQQDPLPPPQGKVLFERHTSTPEATTQTSAPAQSALAGPQLNDADRQAIAVTAYDLDARVTPATSALSMRARITVRNVSTQTLTRIALQISSTLHWETVSAAGQTLPLYQHPLDTDADHTGAATEAIVTLAQPLVPNATLALDTLYSGTIPASTGRLERIGATPAQAQTTDWDEISDASTAVRGFGDVLWYPIAAPQLFLGDGAALFQAIGQARLAGQTTPIHLRLGVEYKGEPPVAVYFCGRRRALTALSDDADSPIASGSGVATADFATEPLGFRLPNLFLIDLPETLIAAQGSSNESSSSASSSATDPGAPPSTASSSAKVGDVAASSAPGNAPTLLAVETTDDSAIPRLSASASTLTPLLQQWFGPNALSAVALIDHTGQPFADGPFVVAPLASLASSDATPALLQSLTHAWVQTGQPWFDEGLPQFMALLYAEGERGRADALAQLATLTQPLELVEPAIENQTAQPASTPLPKPQGQPLIAAQDEVYFRAKAAAVWWMLRDIAGEKPLQQSLAAWCAQPPSTETPRAQAVAFEKLLEKISSKDLGWFFNDWVLNDRGLPDLTIADVTPRELPGDLKHKTGWLVAVTVRNDGAAAAEVPVILRAGTYTTTRRIRIPGFSSATDRALVEAVPTEVVVNDGTTPETRTSTHTRTITVKTE